MNRSAPLNNSEKDVGLRIANAVLKELDGVALLGLLGLIALELQKRVKLVLFRIFDSARRRGEL